MDVHFGLDDVTPAAVEQAHLKDLDAQDQFGVRYVKYWFNPQAGKAFCLVHAPSADAAIAVHNAAHGLVPNDIIELDDSLVDAFLGGTPETAHGAAIISNGCPDGGFRTILFTDMEGSTRQTERLGDDAAMEYVRCHNAIVREQLAASDGREVKHTGDGIMASFVSASRAVECATAIQHAFHLHNDRAGRDEAPIRVRIGISAGEPIEDSGDLFGVSVQVAKRACEYADPGQIVVANVVRELCFGKPLEFIDRGDVALKGFEQALRLHEVDWRKVTLG
jgi:class 3 adenylate cyclase